jgi:MYXO-CTERM domain-containing protein
LGVEPAPIYPMVNLKSSDNKKMKTKTTFLLGILTAIFVASAEAQYTTNTLSFYGATWSDGGSLDGSFTIQYDNGVPSSVLSLDVTTGNGTSGGILGYTYLYNVPGQNNTVDFAIIDSSYELMAENTALYQVLYLDWQDFPAPSLVVSDIYADTYCSEMTGAGIRYVNSVGSPEPTPEPTTLALAGLGGLLLFRRRK